MKIKLLFCCVEKQSLQSGIWNCCFRVTRVVSDYVLFSCRDRKSLLGESQILGKHSPDVYCFVMCCRVCYSVRKRLVMQEKRESKNIRYFKVASQDPH